MGTQLHMQVPGPAAHVRERYAMSLSSWSRTGMGLVHAESHRRHQLLGEMLGNLLGTVWVWAMRHRTRRALGDIAEWSPDRLKDIGLTRQQALHESAKFFWQG